MSSVDPVNADVSQKVRPLSEVAPWLAVDFEIAFKRRLLLCVLEVAILLACCVGIVALWENQNPPPVSFACLVAFVLFAANVVCGTYKRAVYLNHVSRLSRSALAHLLGGLVVALPIVVWLDPNRDLAFLVGMLMMAYFISNTLRPVLVEILRAGNSLDHRRKPSGDVSV